MIFGRRGLAALHRVQDVRAWLRLHLLNQLWKSQEFSAPEAQEEMLLDKIRCTAYREALRRTVKPGDIVVDLGAGTGLLSFFAIEAGARHVYAIEMSSIADVAAKLIEANGRQGQITLLREHSTRVRLPELCDVLVTDTLSSFCFDHENILAVVADARQRLLKRQARIIPEVCDTLLVPFSSDEFGPGLLPSHLYGLDYRSFRDRRFATAGAVAAAGKRFTSLGSPQLFARLNFNEITKPPGPATLTFQVCAKGRLDGFLGWFDCRLSEGVALSNAPHLAPNHWLQLCFPVMDQPRVFPGDTITLHLDPHVTAGEAQWQYRVNLSSASA